MSAEDRAAVSSLLERCALPIEDLPGRAPDAFIVARDGGVLVGVAGVERSGEDGLLRSVAVEPSARGSGLGGALVAAAEDEARAAGIRTLYLLTTTAPDFFADRGYERIDRADAPPGIAASQEFTRLCPASAVCMRKSLGGK